MSISRTAPRGQTPPLWSVGMRTFTRSVTQNKVPRFATAHRCIARERHLQSSQSKTSENDDPAVVRSAASIAINQINQIVKDVINRFHPDRLGPQPCSSP